MATIFDDQTKQLRAGITPMLAYENNIRYAIAPDMPVGAPLKYVKITGLGPKTYKNETITTGLVAEMNQSEKDAVDAAELVTAKTDRKMSLEQRGVTYLDERYPNGVATQLSSLYVDAVRDRPDRGSYLRPLVAWREKISADVAAKQAAVDAASTVSAVEAIVLDETTLNSEDPGLDLATAIATTDAMALTSFLDSNAKVTDPTTSVVGVFWLMQILHNRREIFGDSENPLYYAGNNHLIGVGGSVTNLNDIHAKLGWHNQAILKATYSRPTDVLVYYGYPNSYNSVVNAWNNELVAQDMARYGIIVLGQGVEDPGHADYANTSVIIPRVKALNPSALIFGYVTVNQSLSAFQTKVGQWNTLGVHGVFMDEAGYDYGTTATNDRAAFNAKVDYVHAQTDAKLCFANAWNTDHILGTANDPSYPNSTWNPTPTESSLTTSDWIMLESFPINTTAYTGSTPNGYESKADWAVRGVKAQGLRATYGVNIAAQGLINDDNVDGQDMFDFLFVSSLMFSFEGVGSSSNLYGSSTAQVKLWTRPDVSRMGAVWNLSASVQIDNGDSDVYHRYVENAKLSLDFSASAQSSSITKY